MAGIVRIRVRQAQLRGLPVEADLADDFHGHPVDSHAFALGQRMDGAHLVGGGRPHTTSALCRALLAASQAQQVEYSVGAFALVVRIVHYNA